jgi:hypothetical protein
MVRFLCEVCGVTSYRLIELDQENTDNLRAVVTQYMHENGMTFDILSEGADYYGVDMLTIADEDGRVSTYYLDTDHGVVS